ncbi:hypothetical protein J6590_070379 [Homalodisca vitripennis]|nr:hypothetical protein J6590_070379 [Homalodisca vitripennis]
MFLQETTFTQNGLKSGSDVVSPKLDDKPVFKRSNCVQQHDPYSIAVKNICLQQNKCSARYPLHLCKRIIDKPKHVIRYINYPAGSSQFLCTCKQPKAKPYREEYLRAGLDGISEHDKFDLKNKFPLVINSKHDYTSQGNTNIKESPSGKWGKGTFYIDRNGFPWIRQQIPETEYNDYRFQGYIPQNKFQVVSETYKTDKEEIRNDSPILKDNIDFSKLKLEPLDSPTVPQDVPYGTDITLLPSIDDTESGDTLNYGDESSPIINHSDPEKANNLRNESPPGNQFDTKGLINIYGNSYEIPSKHSETEDKTIIFGYGNTNVPPKYTENNPLINDPGKILPYDPPLAENMQVYGYGVDTPLTSNPDIEEYLEIFGYGQSNRTPKYPGKSSSESDKIISQHKGHDTSNNKKDGGRTDKSPFASHHNIGESTDSLKLLGYDNTNKMPPYTINKDTSIYDPYGYKTEPNTNVKDTLNIDGYSTQYDSPTTTTQLQPGSVYPLIYGSQEVYDSRIETPQSHGSTQNLPGTRQLVAETYPDPYGYVTQSDSYVTDMPNVDGYSLRPGLPATTKQQPGSVYTSKHVARVVDSGVGTPQSQESTQKLPDITQLIACKYSNSYGYETEPDSHVTDTQNNDGYSPRPGLPATTTQLQPGSNYPSICETQLIGESGVGTPQSHGDTQKLPDAPQLVAGKYPDAYGYDTDPDSYITDTPNVDGYSTRPGLPTTTTQLQTGSDSGVGTPQSQEGTHKLPSKTQLITGKLHDLYGYKTEPDSYVTDTQNNDGYSTQPGLPTSGIGMPQRHGISQNVPGAPQLVAGKYPDAYGYESNPDPYVTDPPNVDGYSTRPELPTTTTQLHPVSDSGVVTPHLHGNTQNLPDTPQLVAGKYPDAYGYDTDPDSYVTDTRDNYGYSTQPGFPTTTIHQKLRKIYTSIHGARVIDDSGMGMHQSHGNKQNLPDVPQLIAWKYPDTYGYESDPDPYVTDTQNNAGYSTQPGLPTSTTQQQPSNVFPSKQVAPVVDSRVGTPKSQDGTQILPGKTHSIAGKLRDPYGYETEPDSYVTDTQNNGGYSTQPGLPTSTTQRQPQSVYPSKQAARVVDSGVLTPQSQERTQKLPGITQLLARKYPDSYDYKTDPDSYVTDTPNVDDYSTRPELPITTTQLQPGSNYPSICETQLISDSGVGTPQSHGNTQNLPDAPQLLAGKYPDAYGYENDHDSYITDTPNVDGYSTRPGLPTTTTQLQTGSDSGVGTPQSQEGTQKLPIKTQLIAGKLHYIYGYNTEPDRYSTQPGLPTSGVGMPQSHGNSKNVLDVPQLVAGKYPDAYGYESDPDPYVTDTQNNDGYSTQPGLPTSTTQQRPGNGYTSKQVAPVVDSGVGTPQSQDGTQILPGKTQLIAGKYPDTYGYESDRDPYVTNTQNNAGYSTQPGLPTSTIQQQPGSIYPSKQVAPVVDSGVGTPQSHGNTQNLPDAPQLVAGKYPDAYGYETDPDSYITDTPNVNGYSTRPGLPTTTTQLQTGSDSGVGTPQSQEGTHKLPGKTQLIAGVLHDIYGYKTEPDSYLTDTQNNDRYSTQPGLPISGVGMPQSHGNTKNILDAPQLVAGKYPNAYGYESDPDPYVIDTQNNYGYSTQPGLPTSTSQQQPGSIYPSKQVAPVVDSGVGTPQSQERTQKLPGITQLIARKYPDPYGYENDPDSYITDTPNVDGYSTRPGLPTTTTQLQTGSDSGVETLQSQEGTQKLPSKTQLIAGKLHYIYGYNTEPDRYSTQPGLPTSGVGIPQSHGNTKMLLDALQLVAGKYPDAYGYESDPDPYVTDTQNNDGYSTQPGLPTSTTQQRPGNGYTSKQVAPVVDSGVGTPQSQDGTQILPGKTQLIAGKYPDTYGYESDRDPYVTDTQNNAGYSTQPGLPTSTTQQRPGNGYTSKQVAPVVDSGVGTPQSQDGTQILSGKTQLIAGKYPDTYGYETDPDSYVTNTPNVNGYSTRPTLPSTTTQLPPGSVYPSIHDARVVDSVVGLSESQLSTQNHPGEPVKFYQSGYQTNPYLYVTPTSSVEGYPRRPALPAEATQSIKGVVHTQTYGKPLVGDSRIGVTVPRGSTQSQSVTPDSISIKSLYPSENESDPESYVTSSLSVDGHSREPELSSTTTQHPESVYPSSYVTRVVDDSGIDTTEPQEENENPHTFLDWNHPETLSDRTENNENPEYFHRHNKPSLPGSKKIFNYFKEKSPTRTAHFVNMPPSYYRNSASTDNLKKYAWPSTPELGTRCVVILCAIAVPVSATENDILKLSQISIEEISFTERGGCFNFSTRLFIRPLASTDQCERHIRVATSLYAHLSAY